MLSINVIIAGNELHYFDIRHQTISNDLKISSHTLLYFDFMLLVQLQKDLFLHAKEKCLPLLYVIFCLGRINIQKDITLLRNYYI